MKELPVILTKLEASVANNTFSWAAVIKDCTRDTLVDPITLLTNLMLLSLAVNAERESCTDRSVTDMTNKTLQTVARIVESAKTSEVAPTTCIGKYRLWPYGAVAAIARIVESESQTNVRLVTVPVKCTLFPPKEVSRELPPTEIVVTAPKLPSNTMLLPALLTTEVDAIRTE